MEQPSKVDTQSIFLKVDSMGKFQRTWRISPSIPPKDQDIVAEKLSSLLQADSSGRIDPEPIKSKLSDTLNRGIYWGDITASALPAIRIFLNELGFTLHLPDQIDPMRATQAYYAPVDDIRAETRLPITNLWTIISNEDLRVNGFPIEKPTCDAYLKTRIKIETQQIEKEDSIGSNKARKNIVKLKQIKKLWQKAQRGDHEAAAIVVDYVENEARAAIEGAAIYLIDAYQYAFNKEQIHQRDEFSMFVECLDEYVILKKLLNESCTALGIKFETIERNNVSAARALAMKKIKELLESPLPEIQPAIFQPTLDELAKIAAEKET